jgi:hypothetical protein
MGARTIYRTMPPERVHFKLGLANNSIFEKCLNKDEIASHILVTVRLQLKILLPGILLDGTR